MQKISSKNYCDIPPAPYRTFFLEEKGKALFCGAAYPTQESRSAIACERALQIGCDSFLRRPSLSDEALITIGGFINESVYILQEQGKRFLCSASFVYVYKGAGRVYAAGNSLVLHFQNGVLKNSFSDCSGDVIGKSLRKEYVLSREFDLSSGTNCIVVCSGREGLELKSLFPAELLEHQDNDDSWMDRVIAAVADQPCSVSVFILNERKGLPFGL